MIDLITECTLDTALKQQLRESFADVRKYYSLAETKMKLVEVTDGDLYIPSVNELRYAGCHLSKATVANDGKIALGELDKATKHCKRAVYDALEIGITFYLEKLSTFLDDYKHVAIVNVIPDVIKFKFRMSEIRDFITKPREGERSEFWEKCTDLFQEIAEIYKILDHARGELNLVAQQQKIEHEKFEQQQKIELEHSKQQQRIARNRHVHHTILKYATLIVAIIALSYHVYTTNHPNQTISTANEHNVITK